MNYDPMDTDTVTVYCSGAEPVAARRMEIGAYAAKKPEVPLGMTKAPSPPRTSAGPLRTQAFPGRPQYGGTYTACPLGYPS